MAESFEQMLTGGHPNSLGRTVEVVEQVLTSPDRFAELFDCYAGADGVVRLRTSSAVKRVQADRPDLVLPYADRLIDEIGELDQPSAQWTLAQLFDRMVGDLEASQRERALEVMKRNLAHHRDWIVLNTTMETLTAWSARDEDLRAWLAPHLDRLTSDPRRSVAARARKSLRAIASD